MWLLFGYAQLDTLSIEGRKPRIPSLPFTEEILDTTCNFRNTSESQNTAAPSLPVQCLFHCHIPHLHHLAPSRSAKILEWLISLHGIIKDSAIRKGAYEVCHTLVSENGINRRVLALFDDALHHAAIPENVVGMTSSHVTAWWPLHGMAPVL